MLVTERAGRLRIIRNGMLDPQPVAGAPDELRYRRIGSAGRGARLDGCRAASAVRREPLRLPQLHQAARREAANRGDCARGSGTATRSPTRATSSWRHRRAPARPASRSAATACCTCRRPGTDAQDPQHARRQGAAATRRRHAFRQTIRSWARPGTSPRSTRSAIATRSVSPCIPARAQMWQNENGPNGGDEINILKPGAQLRLAARELWAQVSGPVAGRTSGHDGLRAAARVSGCRRLRSSGLAFYTGDRLPKWKGDVFVGALRTGEIPGTGHSSGSCSTRKWRSCGASRCSSNCVSASATCGRVPTVCCIC